eukprot:jgi/Tetstr1/427263/TSEL_017448.t1
MYFEVAAIPGEATFAHTALDRSTRSFFLETASAVTALAVLALLPAVAATLLRIVPVVNVYSIATTGDGSGRRVVPLLCVYDELLSFGCTAHFWRRVLLQTSWTIMLTMVAPVLGVPSVMWSPVAQAATERYKDSEVASLRTPSVAVPQRLAQPMTQFRTFKSENGVARDGRVDKSKYHQQLVVLYVAIYLFVFSDDVDIYAYIGMYIARAIAIMLLFRTKDTPATWRIWCCTGQA